MKLLTKFKTLPVLVKLDQTITPLIKKIQTSFKASTQGKENISILIWYWGVLTYVVFYVLINWLIGMIRWRILSAVICIFAAVYFGWHIYALLKCRPKKPKLSKEEKAQLKEKHHFYKSFGRKFFLQEPWFKWNPITALVVIDILFLLHFLTKI